MAMLLECPSQIVPNEGQVSVNPGIRAMPRQQWEELKPLIEQTYIQENKPFPYLAEVLRRDHGFEPTKRQFSRKIIEWGFRKNIPRGERRVILQRILKGSEETSNVKDHRLKPQKLKNWQRRYRDEVQMGRCSLNRVGRSSPESLFIGSREASTGLKEKAKSHDNNVSAIKNSDGLNEIREKDSVGISFLEIRQNTLPFDWSKVDVHGLPGLVPLFNALHLECYAPGQPLSSNPTESEDSPCLLNSELQDMSSNGSITTIDNINSCLILQRTGIQDGKHRTAYKSPQYPWRDIDNVFLGKSTSPLTEIYVFPPCQAPLRAKKANVVNLWGSLTAEASELETKFTKLEEQFGDHNPAVMVLMEQLSSLYFRLEDYRKAEQMKKRLADVYFRVLGPSNGRTLQAALHMVTSLLAQGQYLKAQSVYHTLRSSVLNLFEREHPLAVLANFTHAKICSEHRRTEEAEKYYRQHLQIMLSAHGPRSIHTIRAMFSLGGELNRNSPKEADILLRLAAQLSFDLPPVDEVPCRALQFVASNLHLRGAYEESYHLVTKLVERFSLPLGDQHPTIWRAREKLAWSMRAVGRLPESIKLFRAVIFHQVERAGEIDESQVNPWCGLANALIETGEIEEATTWNERAFETKIGFYGGSHKSTLSTAYCLGYCYYTICKYEEALNLYTKMVRILHECGNWGKEICAFEAYIGHIQSKIGISKYQAVDQL
ncbi:TPR-like protein [Hyaloscypha bicolor E]|uniref:TPR-like protein n=1 Tax=Hyaloscypha bicolor E TaxID=1095630 RepID=A0A2J6TH19_9HELO|nr:TPR-like protein [Hyaloscypha bicolor E]PMD62303.1 TPR-like protein [Hyaloscypha bicolor E]